MKQEKIETIINYFLLVVITLAFVYMKYQNNVIRQQRAIIEEYKLQNKLK